MHKRRIQRIKLHLTSYKHWIPLVHLLVIWKLEVAIFHWNTLSIFCLYSRDSTISILIVKCVSSALLGEFFKLTLVNGENFKTTIFFH